MENILQHISLIGAVLLPLWNIPLIVRMVRRRSSADISLYWAVGVWFCLMAMLPAGIQTSDIVFKVFTVVNFIFFTGVTITALIYRKH